MLQISYQLRVQNIVKNLMIILQRMNFLITLLLIKILTFLIQISMKITSKRQFNQRQIS